MRFNFNFQQQRPPQQPQVVNMKYVQLRSEHGQILEMYIDQAQAQVGNVITHSGQKWQVTQVINLPYKVKK